MRDFALLISEFNVVFQDQSFAKYVYGLSKWGSEMGALFRKQKRESEHLGSELMEWNGVSSVGRGNRKNLKEMKFYISSAGIKKVAIPNSGSGKGSSAAANRRFSNRTFLPVVLLLAICLPFLFVRIAFLVLESATLCSSLGNFLLDWKVDLFLDYFYINY